MTVKEQDLEQKAKAILRRSGYRTANKTNMRREAGRRLAKSKRATKTYHDFINSGLQFQMTFADFKRRQEKMTFQQFKRKAFVK